MDYRTTGKSKEYTEAEKSKYESGFSAKPAIGTGLLVGGLIIAAADLLVLHRVLFGVSLAEIGGGSALLGAIVFIYSLLRG